MRTTRREVIAGALASFSMGVISAAGSAEPTPALTVLQKALIFDGTGTAPKQGALLIEGARIKDLSEGTPAAPEGAVLIDCAGGFVMPGLTDAHYHLTLATNHLADFQMADMGLVYANATAEARNLLMRGFTTIRDMAGPTFGLKAAIDAGSIPGPRIYPSGALISQTGGHGDFGTAFDRPTTLGGSTGRMQDVGLSEIANGSAEVRAAVREQFRRGASQVKIAISGGVLSDFDPIDSLQFSIEEMRAAVECAQDWGTYVAAHVYSIAGIRRALEAGVRSIEHGLLADRPTIAAMARQGVWLSTQAFGNDAPRTAAQLEKIRAGGLDGGWQRVLGWAKQEGTRVAFGTDILFAAPGQPLENVMLTRFAQIFTNAETLRIATSGNCELFACSGRRNPYREATLGQLRSGAWADLIVMRGNPIDNIDVITNPDRNFQLIMKGGCIHKNALTHA